MTLEGGERGGGTETDRRGFHLRHFRCGISYAYRIWSLARAAHAISELENEVAEMNVWNVA